ncbi:MAG: addiction module antidote protein, HigA family [Bdellovibrionales bacterium RIFOXYB1_FULL_37_110]|nr:MAG: addiction module antidote protein, HigA family [Bdellovibrionales bacterium RIFOXYC1_FULL_37_79]OFZ57160.1 MAG: addiction module antidote protein, HigA family [Bdellovibrionales bacterium RIFOXYB1_FULL_37_110]OFZ64902.1 MAG: addiction module antidote protein, HigA family [Bdellovibrionales bacterium RIFOXYD1_FULL_36_51]
MRLHKLKGDRKEYWSVTIKLTWARLCGCSPRKINEIINEKRGISPDFALVLERVLGTTAEMWVRMQAEYDLWQARKKAA